MARVWIYSILGLTMALPGAYMVLASLGAFGPVASSGGTPVWIGTLIGLVFVAGGTSAIVKTIYGGADATQSELPASAPAVVRLFYNVCGLAIVGGLGALFTWVGFGPGERHFTGSGAFLGDSVGRGMFGLFGILVWLSLLWFGVRWLKRRHT